MASNIGIKIANGEFYPIIQENSSEKKRLILTTVHNNQPSVQIDLFRSPGNEMSDAQYIGTVVVEKIKPKPKGEPSIEMIISSDENGNIVADAADLDTGEQGEHHILTVSLKSMDESARDADIPDFELDAGEEPPSGLYQHAERIRQREKSSPKPWIFILIGVLLILGLLAAWLFFFGGFDIVRSWFSRPAAVQFVRVPLSDLPPEPVITPPETAVNPEPIVIPVQQVIAPPPVISAPVTPPPAVQASASIAQSRTVRRSPPVASYNVPSVIPREGINYLIRWGDTLWDISEAFYRDPWQYPRIARYNSINNPGYIISGRTIRIPPRS